MSKPDQVKRSLVRVSPPSPTEYSVYHAFTFDVCDDFLTCRCDIITYMPFLMTVLFQALLLADNYVFQIKISSFHELISVSYLNIRTKIFA